MANINAVVKRKQYLWLAGIGLGLAAAVGGGWYLSEIDMSSNEGQQTQEPPPDLTGVVDAQFDDKVQQHAITQTQVAQKEINEQFSTMRQEIDLLSKARQEDQKRIDALSEENKKLAEQLSGPGTNNTTPGVPGSAPLPNTPVSGGFTPEGEPMPAAFPPTGGGVPPPTAFYPGRGTAPPAQVTYTNVPVPGQIHRQSFSYGNKDSKKKKYPYIPTGSFAKALIIEGADANASVTGNEATAPMQVRLIGKVEMPNSKTYDLTGCFISLESYGDVSSERAITRTRKISCIKGDDVIDQPIEGHVSFMGKNGIKGEVVMRNGKILGFAWGAGFLDGIGQGVSSASQPVVGIGGSASVGAGDVFKSGIGGGTSKAAQTLGDYYIKRAEQYHPIIPIGAGNEVTVVFQEGFQLKTLEELETEKNGQRPQEPAQTEQQSGQNLNGFNTDQMLNKLGNLDFSQFGGQPQQQQQPQGGR